MGKKKREIEREKEEAEKKAQQLGKGKKGKVYPSRGPPANLTNKPKTREVEISATEEDSGPNRSSDESEEHDGMRIGVIVLDNLTSGKCKWRHKCE